MCRILKAISNFLYSEVRDAWYDEDEELWLE